ncbi:MAG: NigD-like protein [Bacteroidaceae bacterium]
MKKYPWFLCSLLFISALSFQSCDDDDDPETYSLAIGTLMKNESKNYYLELDSEKKFLPTDSAIINYYKVGEGQRVLTTFATSENQVTGYDRVIQIVDLYKILTKPVVKMTEAMNDSIGDDKIEIEDMWISKNFLNIRFQMMGANQKSHMLNLVSTETPKQPEEGYQTLEFRHNLEGDCPARLYWGIVSFNLGDLSKGDLKGLKIRVNTIYRGEQFYNIDFEKRQPTPKLNPAEFKLGVR